MSVDISNLEEIIKNSEKNYKSAFHKGSEFPHVMRIPFISPELNIATGGGIPMGKISRLWGEPSAGKSLASLLVARNAQNIHLIAQQLLESEYDEVKEKGEELLQYFPEGMKVCWYDLEGSFDKRFAKQLGVNVDELEVLDDRRIEVVGGILEAALSGAHLHIIDSTAGGVSLDELKAPIEDWQRGLKPRVWNKAVDRFQARIDRKENAIIFIDQVRIDQKTGAYIVPGGEKLKHESGLTVQFRRGKKLWKKDDAWTDTMPQKSDTLTGRAEIEGVEFNAHVEKSRVGQPHRRALSRYETKNRRFDIDYELAKIAEYFQVVEKSGNWFVLPSGKKVNGVGQLQQSIIEDTQLKQKTLDVIEKYIIDNP